MVEGVLRQPRTPRFVKPLFECATLIGPVLVVVRRGDDRADAGEMRWMADCGEHLRRAHVRSAEHADFAIGVRQSCRPLHRVVAVVDLVLEGVPLTLGGIAATDVLHDDHEASGDSMAREVGGIVLVIGRALQKDREGSFAGGTIDVGLERDTVAGLHRDVAFEDQIAHGLRHLRCGGLSKHLRCGQRFENNQGGQDEHESSESFSGHGFPRDESRSNSNRSGRLGRGARRCGWDRRTGAP